MILEAATAAREPWSTTQLHTLMTGPICSRLHHRAYTHVSR